MQIAALKQVVYSCMAYMKMFAAGCGTEAAIGQLTCLTSLHLSVRCEDSPVNTLQLQLLGCGQAAGGSEGGATCHSSDVRGGTSAKSSMGLQELLLKCTGQLSDDELVGAAAALPDLRRLEVDGYCDLSHSRLRGLVGTGLAAFGACRRLRHISLRCCEVLEGQQLVMQLPRISSLASVLILDCPGVDSRDVGELQATFRHQYGRHLQAELAHI